MTRACSSSSRDICRMRGRRSSSGMSMAPIRCHSKSTRATKSGKASCHASGGAHGIHGVCAHSRRGASWSRGLPCNARLCHARRTTCNLRRRASTARGRGDVPLSSANTGSRAGAMVNSDPASDRAHLSNRLVARLEDTNQSSQIQRDIFQSMLRVSNGEPQDAIECARLLSRRYPLRGIQLVKAFRQHRCAPGSPHAGTARTLVPLSPRRAAARRRDGGHPALRAAVLLALCVEATGRAPGSAVSKAAAPFARHVSGSSARVHA
jgi:hypothetical protein